MRRRLLAHECDGDDGFGFAAGGAIFDGDFEVVFTNPQRAGEFDHLGEVKVAAHAAAGFDGNLRWAVPD